MNDLNNPEHAPDGLHSEKSAPDGPPSGDHIAPPTLQGWVPGEKDRYGPLPSPLVERLKALSEEAELQHRYTARLAAGIYLERGPARSPWFCTSAVRSMLRKEGLVSFRERMDVLFTLDEQHGPGNSCLVLFASGETGCEPGKLWAVECDPDTEKMSFHQGLYEDPSRWPHKRGTPAAQK